MFSKEIFSKDVKYETGGGKKIPKHSHFYSSTEKALLMYLKKPLLRRENLKFRGRIDFESGICLLGSSPIELHDKAISF